MHFILFEMHSIFTIFAITELFHIHMHIHATYKYGNIPLNYSKTKTLEKISGERSIKISLTKKLALSCNIFHLIAELAGPKMSY